VGSARRVRIGVPDGSLTALAGLAAVDELTGRLGMVTELDRGIGPIKQRDRGLTGGQLLPFLSSGFVPTDTMPVGLRQFAEYARLGFASLP
jgi:hypothetical protein